MAEGLGRIGDAYASPQEYRAYKDKSDSSEDDQLALLLKAVSRLIDRKVNQPFGFNEDDVVSTRVYGSNEEIAPIASTAGLVVKASSGRPITWGSVSAMTLDTDFELTPRNPAYGWPYTSIELFGWSSGSSPSVWTPQTYAPDDYRVQVTAIHGWPEVPDEIMFATIELAALLRPGDSAFATNRFQELDETVGASSQARAILKNLYAQFNPRPIAVG